jgi:hypothetical protein
LGTKDQHATSIPRMPLAQSAAGYTDKFHKPYFCNNQKSYSTFRCLKRRNPMRCKSLSTFIIPYLYEAQHVSGDTPPIIRSLKLHSQLLVFIYVEGCWTCCCWMLSGSVYHDHLILYLTASSNHTSNNLPYIQKPEADSAV